MSFAHFVFVDFENSPEVDLQLIAGKSAHVTLLIGKNQTKLPTELSIQLNTFSAQALPISLGESGHNALDLTLAYYLGQAANQWPAAKFHIVSKDGDFDPMIRHLVRSKIGVYRCGTFRELPFLDPVKRTARPVSIGKPKSAPPPIKAPEDRRSKLITRLTNPTNRNRPATEKALCAHINTGLGKDSSEPAIADVMNRLKQTSLTVQPSGKLVWSKKGGAGDS